MRQEPNDCQNAMLALLMRDDTTGRADSGRGQMQIFIKRRAAHAGEISDGMRQYVITNCPRWRWIVVSLGWETIAEIDQRGYFQRPEDMADAVLARIERHAAKGFWPASTELTPEGEQAVIPGCERNASPKAKQFDLFG